MSTKFLITVAVGTIVTFLLGWLVFGILLMDFYTANTTAYAGLVKDPPVLWAILLSNLCWVFLVTYIFDKWAGIRSLTSGAGAGMIIGFLLGLTFNFSFHAFMNLYNTTYMITDVIVNTIFSGIIGGAIGWMLGYGKKAE